MKTIKETIEAYKKKIEVCDIVREVIKKLEHTKQVNKRLETEFKKLAPKYSCYFGKDYSQYHFKVWGNGIDYNNAFFMCMNESAVDKDGWKALTLELDRCDVRDYLERLEQEQDYYAELEKLSKQIEAIKEKARNICPKNVPVTAKLRSESCYWDDWSYETQEQFPTLFRS